jgi:hypothetical protein
MENSAIITCESNFDRERRRRQTDDRHFEGGRANVALLDEIARKKPAHSIAK